MGDRTHSCLFRRLFMAFRHAVYASMSGRMHMCSVSYTNPVAYERRFEKAYGHNFERPATVLRDSLNMV
jgi:hypothetical protein